MSKIKSIYAKLCKEQKKLKELEREYNSQKAKAKELSDEMLTEMTIIGTSSYSGDLGRLSVRTTTQPAVDDWEALYDYIVATRSFDMLQRRVSATAYRDRLENGEPVPGVEPFEKKTLSITLEK